MMDSALDRTAAGCTEVSEIAMTNEVTRVSAVAFDEQHFPVRYWARRWGFSEKTVREWFRDVYGPSILRQPNTGRRSKRDYVTIMISASAASRIYTKRTGSGGILRRTRQVM
jgi:hypothetical protein